VARDIDHLEDPRFGAPPDSGRRQFLKVSAAGALLLVSASVLVRRTALGGSTHTTNSYSWLEPEDARVIRCVAPVLLAGALPAGKQADSAVDDIMFGFDLAVSYLPPSVRAEIRQLFDMLRNPITRALVAGMWVSWERASPEQIRHFLHRWQHSRLQLLRGAYGALHDMIAGSWYGNPRAWPRIGYPGPPKL
jgi:hypothetical protein